MTLTFVILALAVWSVARMIVIDKVFRGTRYRVFSILGTAIGRSGPTAVTEKWTFRAMDRRARRGRQAKSAQIRARNHTSQRAIRIGVRYRRAKEANAVTQYSWLAWGTIYTKFTRDSPGWVFYAVVSPFAWLFRLLAEKIEEGLRCMFCVSVWVAAPAAWIWGPHGFKLWFLWWMGVAGAARVIMATHEVLSGPKTPTPIVE